MTNVATDHIADVSKKVMTHAEMLAVVSAAIEKHYIEVQAKGKTIPKYALGALLDIEHMLRVRVEDEKNADKLQDIMNNPFLTMGEKTLLIEHYKLLDKDKDHA